MKKLFSIICCTLMTCSMFAQNSSAEIASQLTDVEKFMNECAYSKSERIATYKTNSIRMEGEVITNLLNNEKIGGVHLIAKPGAGTIAAAVLVGGVKLEEYDLGWFDISEIDDIIKVLNDITSESKQKHPFSYTMDYYSKAGVAIHFDNNDEVFIRRTWWTTNSSGIKQPTTVSSEDLGMGEVAKIIKCLTTIKEKCSTFSK